jgi:DNA-binding CsgD family transcriptional regulator
MAVAALVTWVVTAGFGFTAHADGEWMTRAAQVGASGFIPKYGSLAEMISMLKVAKPGRMSVPPSMLHTGAAQTAANHQLLAGLILRELEVLGYMGQGLQAKSIAKVMGISVNRCRGYITTVYVKLNVSSRIRGTQPGPAAAAPDLSCGDPSRRWKRVAGWAERIAAVQGEGLRPFDER